MNHQQACRLWETIVSCRSVGTDHDGNEATADENPTAMAALQMVIGDFPFPVELEDYWSDGKNRMEAKEENRKRIAAFLRQWADALEDVTIRG